MADFSCDFSDDFDISDLCLGSLCSISAIKRNPSFSSMPYNRRKFIAIVDTIQRTFFLPGKTKTNYSIKKGESLELFGDEAEYFARNYVPELFFECAED
jgi:hypothetical protein